MLADAEGISVLSEALRRINLSQAVIQINHRKLLEAMALLAGVPAHLAPSVFRAIDKLAKIGRDGVTAELERAGVDTVAAQQVVDLVTRSGSNTELLDAADNDLSSIPGGSEAVGELRQLVAALEDLAVPESSWKIDLSMARGIDYYTGPVFEAVVEEPKVGSVAGGGRYDGLVGTFLGRDVPATGISLGLERILEVITEFQLLPTKVSVAEVIVATFPTTLRENARIATELRAAGISTDLSLLSSRSLGDQMKYGARRGIPWAIVAGSDDLQRNVAQVRNLATGEQQEIPLDDVVKEVRNRISG
jgi:histidyl-tRNA synthetase